MFKRVLEPAAFSPELGRQMRFIAGPRQVGKTTMTRQFIDRHKGYYYNWDQRKIRAWYAQDSHFFHANALAAGGLNDKRWICFDEIHKMHRWKDLLKDFFDSFEDRYQFIVTGSARLDFFRRSGDSLAGRYFLFRQNPLCLAETTGEAKLPEAVGDAVAYLESQLAHPVPRQKELLALLRFSGFPEPLSRSSESFRTAWQRNYLDRLVREDLRDLTRIANLENIFPLMQLLPERMGSPVSVNALSEDLLISYKTVKNLLAALDLMYVTFALKPWHKRIARSLRKEPKLYFFDWLYLKDEGKIFENYVALEWKNRVDLWTDSGRGDFQLHYIRTRDGKETDFLITRDQNPWLLSEAKLSSQPLDHVHQANARILGGIPFVQIVREPNILREEGKNLYQVSASRIFARY
jgi:predicted AAA+ superfamily ATPase